MLVKLRKIKIEKSVESQESSILVRKWNLINFNQKIQHKNIIKCMQERKYSNYQSKSENKIHQNNHRHKRKKAQIRS